MNENEQDERKRIEAEIEREILRERKFTLEEAIGRLAGPGGMKGASPVGRLQQAQMELEAWLRTNLIDSDGALRTVLFRDVRGSDSLLSNVDQPLVVLASYCQRVLDSAPLLEELVRTADVEWGRSMGERPFFEKPGFPCHPDDPYTLESVRKKLTGILQQLTAELS